MGSVAVIDYGMGNLHSVAKALQHVDPHVNVVVTDDRKKISNAQRVVLPGVGALGDCIHALAARGLDEAVMMSADSKPLLGICLGLQALFEFSEENGGTKGLGIVPGRVVQFEAGAAPSGELLKIPHMGWNQVAQTRAHPLWKNIPDDSRFYFVHSYYVVPASPDVITGETAYGDSFACAIGQGNVFAVQFHPEKSQRHGLQLLQNFLRWDGAA